MSVWQLSDLVKPIYINWIWHCGWIPSGVNGFIKEREKCIMPLYEYKCDECGHEFEELVYNESEVICPACDSENTKKQISSFSAGNTRLSGGSGSSCNNFT
jgi:putative FmdB family regulatory protein